MKIPFWATAFTMAGVLILCVLGTWQIQRLHWKTGLLAEIETETAKDPMELALNAESIKNLPPEKTLVSGHATGVFLHDKAILLGPRTLDGKPGYHVITPLRLDDGSILLVNRGWVPWETRETYTRPQGTIDVAGIARKPEKPGLFVAKNVPDKDLWLSLAPAQITAAKNLPETLPYVLYANGNAIPGTRPVPQDFIKLPPNNHLGYALFWFTMAFVLIVIYILRFYYRKE